MPCRGRVTSREPVARPWTSTGAGIRLPAGVGNFFAEVLDKDTSLEQRTAQVLGSFGTTLRGTSACCIVRWMGAEYLAISDFMHSGQTIFVRRLEALEEGSAESAIVFRYRNEGFSQGLELVDGFLYEAENKLGRDVINRIDLGRLQRFADSRKATVIQLRAPSRGIEDLAWDGEAMWTSDESVFRFFVANLVSE